MEHLTRSPAAHPSIHLSIHQSIHPILHQLSTPPLSSVVVPFAVPVVNGTDTRPHRTAAPTPPPPPSATCACRIHTHTSDAVAHTGGGRVPLQRLQRTVPTRTGRYMHT
ncbi:hypothetical protein VFPFJ_08569 [Purpureocillium lilacinum]|uniref:Uncharacterized protein n=1 Tax=Purpureocillium lilacinum TaxID=33203 RepID=A0A179GXR7_PURLI|nr:hypothetical protein VFPFJ_08569 [Purpureocillium lilacinum]OAQ82766.1 hypothetical protein VFPFJ_08569 [Purpureocillium lilacinum]